MTQGCVTGVLMNDSYEHISDTGKRVQVARIRLSTGYWVLVESKSPQVALRMRGLQRGEALTALGALESSDHIRYDFVLRAVEVMTGNGRSR